jgi:hypothetical protein
MFKNILMEILVVVCALFSLIAAIIGLDLPIIRDAISIFFVLYGFIHFPYKIEDRIERPGLGTASVIIALSGVLSFFTGSWWYLPGALLGYFFAFIIFSRSENSF